MLLGSGLLPHLGITGGGGLVGATWAIDGNGRAYNTPTLGAELLTNGDFSAWAAGDPVGWSIFNQFPPTRDVVEDSGRARVYSLSGTIGLSQSVLTTDWYQITEDLVSCISGNLVIYANNVLLFNSNSLGTVLRTVRPDGSTLYAAFNGVSDIVIDNVSVKKINTASLVATIQVSAVSTSLAKMHSVTPGTIAGVTCWIDASNHVIGIWEENVSRLRLEKCVGGVYSRLINVAGTFVADAAIEIRRPSGNTFQLWYNGSQIGTDQTISDTVIADNAAPYYGLFSTYSGNTFSEFRLDGTLIPFGF